MTRAVCPLRGFLIAIFLVAIGPAAVRGAPIEREPKAPVVLDGRVLFHIGASAGHSAQDRARMISARLRREADRPEASWLDGASQDDMLVLRLGGKDLIQLTAADVPPGRSGEDQVQSWLLDIEQALARAKTERSTHYLERAAELSLGAIALAAAVHWLLWRAGRRLPILFARRSARTRGGHGALDWRWRPLLQVIVTLVQAAVWLAVVLYVIDRFPAARRGRYAAGDFLSMTLATPMFSLNEKSYSVIDFVWLIALVIVLWMGVSVLVRLVKSRLVRSGANRGVLEPVAVFVQYGLTFLGLVVILQIAGLNLSSLTILASVLGVGIGFGLQNIANNFVSGVIIAFERPVQVGDFVQLGDLYGTVDRVGTRSTEVRTLDQVTIIVPNSKFLESEVVNWSHGDPLSRIHVSAGVAYGSDIGRVRAALLEAASGHPNVVSDPRPEVRLEGFGDNALNFTLYVWTREPREQFHLKSDLYYRIEANFRRHGVEIPFPQRTFHVPPAEIEKIVAALASPAKEIKLYDPDGARVRHDGGAPVVQADAPAAPIAQGPLAALDIDTLIAAMRGPDGLDIRDRRHLLSVYPRCFVGSEAVEWMVRAQQLTRGEAVRFGQTLVERGIIHHVLDEHPFRDGHFYYRFYADEGIPTSDGPHSGPYDEPKPK